MFVVDERQRRQIEVEGKMPRRVKRKRAVLAENGEEVGQEEYLDYLFPEEV